MSALSSPSTLAFCNMYLNTLTKKTITLLFARYCTDPWPASLTKSERIQAAINLICSDPFIVIAIRSHYDFMKRQ